MLIPQTPQPQSKAVPPSLEQQLHQAQIELAQLKQSIQKQTLPPVPTADDQFSTFMEGPEAYVARIAQAIVDHNADHFLINLREEAEFKGALRAFRVAHPDAVPFETLIFDEVAKIIQLDEDGVLASWSELLEQGLQRFQIVFKETLKNNSELLGANINSVNDGEQSNNKATGVSIETSGPRKMPKTLPSYTREEISKMSPAQFAENEAAIEEAMRLGRIK